MVKRIASAGVVGLVLLAACAAVAEDGRESLPDAPSAVVAAQSLNAPVEEAGSPLNVGAIGGAIGAPAGPMRHDEVLVFDGTAYRRKDPGAGLRHYSYSSSVKQQPVSAKSGSLMGRATHAIARTVVKGNEFGNGRLNSSYLLRTLAAVAKDSASTLYWRRHFSDAAGDFGATVGSDAGMNLWNEFGPGIERLAKNHMPAFFSKIGEHTAR
jgi:hypothetical protein